MPEASPNSAAIPWRDRAFVTIAEAAQILARSRSWVRGAITAHTLEAVDLGPGPMAVSVNSLIAFVARTKPRKPSWMKLGRHPPPRLVIDNTRSPQP